MLKTDITCPGCRAGYRLVELASRPRAQAEFRCLICDHVLEIFDGAKDVAIRLRCSP